MDESLIGAEDVIKPYLSKFKACYSQAIEKYNAVLNNFADPMYNRTKAINFQNIIVNLIKAAFAENDNVVIKEKYESITVVIDSHVCARFKKLNAKGFPSNAKTSRNDAIVAQQMTLGFSDYPPIARVDVGYKLDPTGTDYELLKVVCRKNKKVIWDLYFHDINEAHGTTGVEISLLPVTTKNDIENRRIKFPKENKKVSNG